MQYQKKVALNMTMLHFRLQLTGKKNNCRVITSLNTDLAKWLKCVLYYCNSNVTATITAIFK